MSTWEGQRLVLLGKMTAVSHDWSTYDRCSLVHVTVGGCNGGQGLDAGIAIVDYAVVQFCVTILPGKK